MKIAIITSGDLSDMKGVMNYVHEKAKRMQCVVGIECDVYIIRQILSPLFLILTRCSLSKTAKQIFSPREGITVYDAVSYNNLWYHYGVHNNLIDTKIRNIPLNESGVSKFSKLLSRYDILASHTLIGHYLASLVSTK